MAYSFLYNLNFYFDHLALLMRLAEKDPVKCGHLRPHFDGVKRGPVKHVQTHFRGLPDEEAAG